MNPSVLKHFGEVIESYPGRPNRALEVGGRTGPKSLLRFPSLAGAERICLNLKALESQDGITGISGNANEMTMLEDGSFDLVVCNAMLEHDPFFWRSLSEMKRVLRAGGLLVIGVPGFVRERGHTGNTTATLHYHMEADFYRFSPVAVREVFFEGMRDVRVDAILTPPRVIGHGRKP